MLSLTEVADLTLSDFLVLLIKHLLFLIDETTT